MNPRLLAAINNPFAVHNKALPDELNNMEGIPFLQSLISTAISLGFIIGSVVFFYMLISGGIMWITSRGDAGGHPVKDPGPLVMAKKQITAALVGLAVLLSIYAIIRLVSIIFGVDLLNFKIPTLI